MTSPQRLPRVLGFWQGFGVVVGGVIGASIFLVPSAVARTVPSIPWIFGVWLIGAAITLAGAMTISELAAMMPQAGGGYVYIRAAFGPLVGFLFSWTDALLVRAGAAATIGYTFAIYLARLTGAPAGIDRQQWQGLLAIALLLFLIILNWRGVRWGANVQLAGTIAKIAAVLATLLLPLLLWRGPNSLHTPADVAPITAGGIIAALVPILWTYGGWDQLTHLAEEVKDPGRNLPRLLTGGILTVAVAYLCVVLGIHYVLPMKTVIASEAVGAELFENLLGPAGTRWMAAVIVLSALVSANGAILAGPRACFAPARDGNAPAWLSRIDPRYGTPRNAIFLVGFWAIALIVISLILLPYSPKRTPLFEMLISYVMFGYLFFQALIVLSSVVLRRRHPDWERPFRMPAYPWLAVASLIATCFLMGTLAWNSALEAGASAVIVALGIPLARLWKRSRYD